MGILIRYLTSCHDMARRRTAATALVFALAGCTAEPAVDAAPTQPTPVDQIAAVDAIYEVAPDLQTLPESRIYHTLTDHAWYARAEPLRHNGVAYETSGMPIVASLPEMQHIGAYQGVDYYERLDEPDPVLYVPVFQGYWQPFRAEPQQRPGD
jgi:hypothetical protein